MSENSTNTDKKKQKQGLFTLFKLFLLFIVCESGIIHAYAFENLVDNTQTATLTLVKTVMNSHGNNAVISDFEITTSAGPLNFTITSSASSIGLGGNIATTTTYTSASITIITNKAYTLKEKDLMGYSEGNWNCSNGDSGAYNTASVILNEGESVICSIVNNDQATATLSLNKFVINDNNGTATNTDWVLTASGPDTINGVAGAATVTVANIASGVYTLSESGGPTGYQLTSWTCTAGILMGNQLTLAPNDIAICTATSNDIEEINIPTLSEWMLMLLSLQLLIIGKNYKYYASNIK